MVGADQTEDGAGSPGARVSGARSSGLGPRRRLHVELIIDPSAVVIKAASLHHAAKNKFPWQLLC